MQFHHRMLGFPQSRGDGWGKQILGSLLILFQGRGDMLK
jgi:hypothetical protein